MKKIFEKVPYPIAGLMLALATLGNLLGGYGAGIRYTCGALSGMILILLIGKMVVMPKSIVKAFEMLPIASIMVTLPMGIMLLTTYTKPFLPILSKGLWLVAAITNVIFVGIFTVKHLYPFKMEKVFASYLVTYVGVVVITVTGGLYDFKGFAINMFVFGLATYAVLLPTVTYRYMKNKGIPEPLRPIFAIYAAPANLLVVGGGKLVGMGITTAMIPLISILWFVGIITTIIVYRYLPRFARMPFYPSYSAMTFPLVIGAMATKVYGMLLSQTEVGVPELILVVKGLGLLQMIVAVITVAYVLVEYTKYIIEKPLNE